MLEMSYAAITLVSAQRAEPGTSRSVHQPCFAADLVPADTFILTSALDLFIAVLDDLGRDVGANVVLLAASLGGSGGTRDGHRCT